MMGKTNTQRGFTIVELLIVIVVIGILATITVVSYQGIQERSRSVALQSDLRQAAMQLETMRSDDYYPQNVDALKKSPSTTYVYTTNVDRTAYCLAAVNSGGNQSSHHISSVNRQVSASMCPAGQWTFTGGSGDSSMYARNSVNNGAVQTYDKNGRANSAQSFNGTSSHINVSSSTPLPMSAGTLSAWVKLQDTGQPQNIIFYGSASEDGCTGYPAIALSTCGLVIQGDAGVINVVVPTITDNQWHFVVGLWDSTAGYARVYIDGTLRTSSALPFIPNFTQAVANIGKPGSNSRYTSGDVDDIRVYDRAISENDVMALYVLGPQ